MKSYRVNEIFYSLQGEGANTGRAAAFIRFAGCNLCCSFCDTDFNDYTEMTADEILHIVNSYPTRFVVLTGGEPSLQVDTTLLDLLHCSGWYIAIETNGTHFLPDSIDWITVSPKADTKLALDRADEVKVVYLGRDVQQYITRITSPRYYLQPCSLVENGIRRDNVKDVVAYILLHSEWRLSLQTHKLIGIN